MGSYAIILAVVLVMVVLVLFLLLLGRLISLSDLEKEILERHHFQGPQQTNGEPGDQDEQLKTEEYPVTLN